MTLYTISFVLLFFACAAEAYRKHCLPEDCHNQSLGFKRG